jgi:hypothetical protein
LFLVGCYSIRAAGENYKENKKPSLIFRLGGLGLVSGNFPEFGKAGSASLVGVESPHADLCSDVFGVFLCEKVVDASTGMGSEGEGFLASDLDALILDLVPEVHEVEIGDRIFPVLDSDAVADGSCVVCGIRTFTVFVDEERHFYRPCLGGLPSQMRHNHYARRAKIILGQVLKI